LLLRNLGAPLDDDSDERVGVYLTNALTGWKPPEGPKQHLISAELEQERDAAERVKRESPILVIIGNPPYDGFADVAIEEERDLSEAYRITELAPAPQGQGLNNLFIRFFRMAERRIVERTGRGVICYITDYSWLDKPSFTGMREKYLKVFDSIRIDCLNGDKFRTGKQTPDGQPDPSIFSTEWNRDGIQVGTAVALLVRKEDHVEAGEVHFRNLWGKEKRAELSAQAGQNLSAMYETIEPPLVLGLPFMPMQSNVDYEKWPKLPDLIPVVSAGVKTSRDLDLVDIDRSRLEERMRAYFDPTHTIESLKQVVPSLTKSSKRFDPEAVRAHLLRRGIESGQFVPFSYQPFDTRTVY
jgi:predicted helicase